MSDHNERITILKDEADILKDNHKGLLKCIPEEQWSIPA